MNRVKRAGCLILTLCMVLLGTACQDDSAQEEALSMSGVTIQPGVVIVTHPTKDSTVMEIAENTTLERFTQKVVAEESYRIAVIDADGQTVTQPDTMILDGMMFVLYQQGDETPVKTVPFRVVDPRKVDRFYAQISQ